MPIEIIQATKITGGNGSAINNQLTMEVDLLIKLSKVIPANSADLEVLLPVTVANLKYLSLKSTLADVTIQTNDGTTPDDTINLVAGKMSNWSDLGIGTPAGVAAQLGTDTTSIFVTSVTADTATVLEIVAGLDA